MNARVRPLRPGRDAPDDPVVPLAAMHDQETVDVGVVFRMLRRQIGVIAAVSIAVFLAAVVALLGLERPYHATTRLLLHPSVASELALPDVAEAERLNLSTEVERLWSRDIAEKVVRRLRLDEREEFNPALRETSRLSEIRNDLRTLVRGEPGEAEGGEPGPSDPMDRILPPYYAALDIGYDDRSNVIRIGFHSLDRHLAAAVPNALIDIYLEERRRRLAGRMEIAGAWLAVQIAAQRDRVERIEADLMALNERAEALISGGEQHRLDRIFALTREEAEISRERGDLTALIDELETPGGVGGSAADFARVETPRATELRDQLERERQALRSLLAVYGANHASVLERRARIDAIDADLAGEKTRFVRSLRDRLADLARREGAVREQLGQARRELSRYSEIDARREDLRRTVETERALLRDLRDHQRAVASRAEIPIVEAEVLAPAAAPLVPEGRSLMIYALLAAAGAGMAGVTVGCLREIADTSLRSLEQFEGVPGVVPAGLLPALSRRHRRGLARRVRDHPDAMFPDAVRGLAQSLFGAADGVAGSVLVAGIGPESDSADVAAALAVVLAREGRAVIATDADLREGRLHDAFDMDAAPGLAEAGRDPEAVSRAIRRDPGDLVEVLARGRAPMAEDGRPPLGPVLSGLPRRRDATMVVNAAPVLTSSETVALAARADRVVLVARWGRTRHGALTAALQRLRSGGVSRVALCLDGVDPRRHALYGFSDAALFASAVRSRFRRMN